MYIFKKTPNIYLVDGKPVDRRDAKTKLPHGASTCALRDVLIMYFLSRNPRLTYDAVDRRICYWINKNLMLVRALEYNDLWFPALKRRT